jgi:hypothetical protein
MPSFLGKQTDDIRVVRYINDTDQWESIPFQVDELDGSDSYFGDKNGILDPDDEIVFMARHLGDHASETNWMQDNEAKSNLRYKFTVEDRLYSDRQGWIYIYYSSTIPVSQDTLIRAYEADDRVETETYQVIHGSSGLQHAILLQSSAGGDSIDILDRQKMRLKIKLDLGTFGSATITLKEVYDYDLNVLLGLSINFRVKKKSVKYSTGSVVRLHRSMSLQVSAKGLGVDEKQELPFITTFYPTFSEWQPEALDIAQFDQGTVKMMRLSTDLNSNSDGMLFYNSFNTGGVVIDGNEESSFDHSLNWPGTNWHLITADPQNPASLINNTSIVSIITLAESPIGTSQQLYFKDDKSKDSKDSGDDKSYGDTGLEITGSSITGILKYYSASYYLPENLDMIKANDLVTEHQNPLQIDVTEEQLAYELVVNIDPQEGGSVNIDGTTTADSTVILTAVENPGYQFIEWTGDVTDTAKTVSLLMDGPKNVTAHFARLRGIIVATKPAGLEFKINDETYKSRIYFSWTEGDTISICVDSIQTYIPDAVRYLYSSWSHGKNRCHEYIVPDYNETITVSFNAQFHLSTSINPDTAGEIKITPDNEWLDWGTIVTLEASPKESYTFVNWSNDLTGTENPTTLTMNYQKQVTAHFARFHNITVYTDPSELEITANGINYQSPVSFNMKEGDTLSICTDSIQTIYEPDLVRFLFSAWDDSNNLCFDYMIPEHDDTLTALFTTQYHIETSVIPDSSGSIILTPQGEWFDDSSFVSVEAIPAGENVFLKWSIGLEGSSNPDSIFMDESKTIFAHFGNVAPTVDMPDTSFNEDDTLMITLDQIYMWVNDNNNDSTLNIDFFGGKDIDTKYDSTLKQLYIYSKRSNWNGADTISIRATDPIGASDSDNVVITIVPVPDPPGPFSLLTPSDSTGLTEWRSRVHFSWTPSLDPDTGDLVSYMFELDTSLYLSEIPLMRLGKLTETELLLSLPFLTWDETYFWRVQAIDQTGLSTWCDSPFQLQLTTAIEENGSINIPESFILSQNFPNPFNAVTEIQYGLPANSHIRIAVYNSYGQHVVTLVDKEETPGYHTVKWPGKDSSGQQVSTGLYFIMLQNETTRIVRKAILIQ